MTEKDLEKNDKIQIKRVKLEFHPKNQDSASESDTKLVKLMMIILGIMFVFCCITFTGLALPTKVLVRVTPEFSVSSND